MKKQVVSVMALAIGASMLMVACQDKGAEKVTKVETTVETEVSKDTSKATESTALETKIDESIKAETLVEAEQLPVSELYADVDFSVYKANEQTTYGKTKQFGEVARDNGNGTYLVYVANGPFNITISDETKVNGVITEGSYVEFVDDGVATMSYPGQITVVHEVNVVEAANVLVKDSVEKVKTYPEVSSEDGKTVFYGEVKSVEDREGTMDYLVETSNGEKIFHVNKDLVKDLKIETGVLIKVVTDGVETRSMPGQLSGIESIELY